MPQSCNYFPIPIVNKCIVLYFNWFKAMKIYYCISYQVEEIREPIRNFPFVEYDFTCGKRVVMEKIMFLQRFMLYTVGLISSTKISISNNFNNDYYIQMLRKR